MKQPLTLKEQVQRLKVHGFIVDDEKQAEYLLSRVNYYRLRGYWLTFEKDDKIKDGVRFQDVLDVYNFDQELRHWLFSAIEPIEIRLRTQFAYVLAHQKGMFALDNAELFSNVKAYRKCMNSVDRETERAKEMEVPFVIHNLKEFGTLPVWASVELMSFGTLSRLFGILKPDLQHKISREFGVHENYLTSWTYHLSYVRNICAHYSRFYNRVMKIKPRLLKRHKRYASPKEFPTFLAIKESTDKDDWSALHSNLSEIINNSDVDIKPMRFPANWHEVLMK